jgi:DNA modification methylase
MIGRQNRLYFGDNLDVLRKLRDETVDLCYVDPPFNSKRNYNQIYNNVGSEDRARTARKLRPLSIPGYGTISPTKVCARFSITRLADFRHRALS